MFFGLNPGKCQCVINRVELSEINARWNGCSGMPLSILIKTLAKRAYLGIKTGFPKNIAFKGMAIVLIAG